MRVVKEERNVPSSVSIWSPVIVAAVAALSLACPRNSPPPSPLPVAQTPTESSSTPPTQEVVRERRTKLERALDANRAVEAFLGVDGELVFLGNNDFARGVGVRFAVILNDPGLELVNLKDWQGGNMWSTYATVTPDGIVSYHTGRQKSAELSAAPHNWTVKDGSGSLGLPTTGTVLCDEGAKSGPLAEPPSGNAGWVVLGYGGLLFTPPSQENRPPNVLWVIPKKEGGFDLVHSGPLHQGIYASIQADRRIVLGSGADGLPCPTEVRGQFWEYLDYHTAKPTIVPPGFTASIHGVSSLDIYVSFKDGEPSASSNGNRIIQDPLSH